MKDRSRLNRRRPPTAYRHRRDYLGQLVISRPRPAPEPPTSVGVPVGVELGDVAANALGRTRLVREADRDWVVVPAALLVANIEIPGSGGPLVYPAAMLVENAPEWEGVPVTVGHPDTGRWQDAALIQSLSVGAVRSPAYRRGKLVAELWLDPAALNRVAPDVLDRVYRGEVMEVSTGVYTRHDGRVVHRLRPHHLALLPNELGACSVRDGCGLMVNRHHCRSPDPVTAAYGCEGCVSGDGCWYALTPGRLAGLSHNCRVMMGWVGDPTDPPLPYPERACPEVPGANLRRN